MPSDNARRGRPRGSGLDDRVQLRRIADLLDADPLLRPTTAIKAMGISDPSTIRRLRDKLKAEFTGEPARVASPSSAPIAGLSAELLEARPAANPTQSGRSPGGALMPELAAEVAAQVDTPPISPTQLAWFAHWCALGLSAMTATVEAQMAVMDDFLQVPPVASALRHQLRVNEVAKAFCPKRTDVRSTLH